MTKTRDPLPLPARIAQLRKCLRAIRDYEPNEVAKDEFAYDRMVENFQAAARRGLRLDSNRS